MNRSFYEGKEAMHTYQNEIVQNDNTNIAERSSQNKKNLSWHNKGHEFQVY